MKKQTKQASAQPVIITADDIALLDVIMELVQLDDEQVQEACQRYAEAKG